MFVPNMPGPVRYHEEITSYQIVEYHPGETPADLRFTVLYNASSARMTWLMLREINKHRKPAPSTCKSTSSTRASSTACTVCTS